MPELPEVQALSDVIAEQFTGHWISRAELGSLSALKTYDPPMDVLADATLLGTGRRGKFLILDLADSGGEPFALVVHLSRAGWIHWRSGRLATAVASYTLKMPEPTLVPTLVPTEAPPAGDTRPPFFNSVAYPSEYCFGDTLEVSAEVYDDTGVTDVRFHYLVLNVDPEFPEYGGYPYETVDLGSGKSSYTAQFAVGDLNSASFYFTATDAAGNEGQTDTISLVGRDCGPVVK